MVGARGGRRVRAPQSAAERAPNGAQLVGSALGAWRGRWLVCGWFFFPRRDKAGACGPGGVVTRRSRPSSGLGSVTSGSCRPFPRSTFHRPGTAGAFKQRDLCMEKTNKQQQTQKPTAKHKANQQKTQNKAQTIKWIKSQIQLIRKTLKKKKICQI